LKALFSKDEEKRSEQIVSLLAEAPASPALRSALYQLLAKSPTVTVNPKTVKDSHGRPGMQIDLHLTAQSYVGKKLEGTVKPGPIVHYTNHYIVDPRTSRVLEAGDSGPNPLVRTTYLEVGWRNEIG
jgi:hypothetical protein